MTITIEDILHARNEAFRNLENIIYREDFPASFLGALAIYQSWLKVVRDVESGVDPIIAVLNRE
jgi:hypothetical protein